MYKKLLSVLAASLSVYLCLLNPTTYALGSKLIEMGEFNSPPPAPVFDTAFFVPTSSCGGQLTLGSLTALSSGGNGTLTYHLSGSFVASNTTGTFNNLRPGGVYSILVTDSLGYSVPLVNGFNMPTIQCDTMYRGISSSGSTDTSCFSLLSDVVSGCSGSNVSGNGINFTVSNSCVIYPSSVSSLPSPFVGDESCIIVCDTIYTTLDSSIYQIICDTTRINYYTIPTPDSSLNYLPTFGGLSVCADTSELIGSSLTYSMEKVPNFGIFNQNSFTSNCFTYIPVYNMLDSAIVVVCDELGVCDTSLFVFVPYTTNDTIHTYETDLCVDTMEISGVYDTIRTCDGLGLTSSFGTVSFGSGACISISPNLVLGSDTTCIVICNNDLGICDTTVIVSFQKPISDTLVIFPNGTTINTCLNTSELAGNIFSYSVISSPLNGSMTNADSCFKYLPIVNKIDSATVVICDEFNICDTTKLIFIPAQTIDTIYRGIPKSGATDTTCISTTRTGGPYSINSCTGTDGTYDGVLFNKYDSCVVYPFNILTLTLPFTGDTACVILCDTVSGVLVCDTTILVYYPIPEPDTIITILPASGRAVTVCADESELLRSGSSYSYCSIPKKGALQKTVGSCYNYNAISQGLDTACVIVCDDLDVCDTTYFIFVPPVTTDTIYTQDSTVCIDTTELPGMRTSVSTCDGSGQTSNGGTISFDAFGCATISPNYIGITDTSCVIVCNAILGICDTTFIISVQKSTLDTIFQCIPRNGQANYADANTTELLGTIHNKSVFKLPAHGQFTLTNDTNTSYQTSPSPVIDTVMVSYCDEYSFCDTFLFIYIPPMSVDTIYMQGAGQICLDTLDMVTGNYTSVSTCDGSNQTINGGSVISTGNNCVAITPDFSIHKTDTTCLILCDSNLPVCQCDTTYIISFRPTRPDTFAIQLPKGINTADTCLSTSELIGSTYTYRRLGSPAPHGPVSVHNDTCINYVQTSVTKFLDTAKVLICDEYGMCDTTVIIYVPSPTADTFLIGPIVPSANTDTCVDLESTFMTGTSIGTCDGSGTTSGGVATGFTGLCVRYAAPSPIFNGDTGCIIVCDTIRNLVVCDTTILVYLPDTSNPTVLCKNDTLYLSSFGTAIADTSHLIDTIYDNTLIHSVWISQTNFNCTDVGISQVTLYAQDTNRNIDSCVGSLLILDTISPLVICRNITVSLDSNGIANISAMDVDGGTIDNCAIASLTLNQTTFNCEDLGLNQVELTAIDVNGNSSRCIAVVTVEDNIAPELYCPSINTEVVIRNTTCSLVVEDYLKDVSAWDNCFSSGISYVQSPAAGISVSVPGDILEVTVTATDAGQNTTQCVIEIPIRCIQELDIPQFISPNGDGTNDTWEIFGLADYPENIVKVFNRWGALVFESKGYVSGWDGRSNVNKGVNQLMDNKMLPEGTYYYVIDLNKPTFEPYVGYLQIKR